LARPTLETVRWRDQNVREVEFSWMTPELEDSYDLATVPTQEVEVRFPVGATEVGTIWI
jgi:hypothetical protein